MSLLFLPDGTRAGIIDQTITVTFLPWLFGRDNMSQEARDAEEAAAKYQAYAYGGSGGGGAAHGQTPSSAHPNSYGYGSSYPHGQSGISRPGTAPVTPHPFANYSQTPGASSFSRFGPAGGGSGSHLHGPGASHPQSPVTPFSVWGGGGAQEKVGAGGNSRPHTPGWASAAAASGFFGHMRPLSSAHPRTNPSSVVGDDDEGDHLHDDEDDDGFGMGSSISQRHAGSSVMHTGTAGTNHPYMSYANGSGSGTMTPHHQGDITDVTAYASNTPSGEMIHHTYHSQGEQRPAMPDDLIAPHWSNEGFGRSSVRSGSWSVLHPRKALKSLCSIQLRLMSRLEFNDAGRVVRHEDTWGLREAIEGAIPFASICESCDRIPVRLG